jgi:hypothetical protein
VSDFLVGVHGLRTFRVSDDGNLLPIIALDDSWRGGVCIAACRRNAGHPAPVEGCRCGIYTFRSLPVLRAQYEHADHLVAVVALEGQTLAGIRGWRSQAGRVLAVWVAPGALPKALLGALVRNLPDVVFHDDIDAMVSQYPDLSVASPVGATTDAALVLRPAMVRTVRLHRVPMYVLATALSVVMFLMAAHQPTAGGPWSPIAGLGGYLGSHLQHVFFPLLIVGLWIRARRIRGAPARFVSALLGMLFPVCIGAVVAELMLSRPVGIDPVFLAYIALISWMELWQFAYAVGRTDGGSGVAARQFLHIGRNLWYLLRPSRRRTGVNFNAHIQHSINGYPLIMPVHFEATPR